MDWDLGIFLSILGIIIGILTSLYFHKLSLKKLKISWPHIRYTEKFSMLWRNTVENTIVSMTMVPSGFSTDHRKPRKERRYLILTSLLINSFNKGMYLFSPAMFIPFIPFLSGSHYPVYLLRISPDAWRIIWPVWKSPILELNIKTIFLNKTLNLLS